MFDSRVRNRLPTECQKYRTRWGRPARKREPNTTSARPSSSGINNSENSAGSYSRSASCTTTKSAVASLNPRRNAAPLPMFVGWRKKRTRSSVSPSLVATSAVESTEPSSTITSSAVHGDASTLRAHASSVASSL